MYQSILKNRLFITMIFAALMILLLSLTSLAYPDKPIELVVTYGPGGMNDIAARGIQPALADILGVPVNVRNMPGAGGRLGREFVFRAEPDGYTLVQTGEPSTVIGELIADGDYKTLEFEYIGNFWGGDYRAIIIKEGGPYKNFEELMKASKEKVLNGASSGGIGSTSHYQSLLLKTVIGFEHQFIPFDSDAEAAGAVMGGHTDFALTAIQPLLPMIESGRIKCIAIHAPKRSPSIPTAPTFKELGYEGVELATTTGLLAPPGTPSEIVEILRDAFVKALDHPQFKAWAEKAGIIVESQIGVEFYNSMKKSYNQIMSIRDELRKGFAQ